MKKAIKILIVCLTLALMVSMLVACTKATDNSTPNGEIKPISISASNATSSHRYYQGDEFTIEGIDIYLNKSNGSAVLATDDCTYEGYDKEKAGEQVITAKYDKDGYKFQTTFKVNVIELKVESFTVFALGFKDEEVPLFRIGDEFSYKATYPNTSNTISIYLRVTYNNGKAPTSLFIPEDIQPIELTFDTSACHLDSEGKFTQSGTFDVVVTYKEKQARYQVYVGPAAE